MLTEIFLNNIAYIFFFTTGDLMPILMALILAILVFVSIFYRLTRD